MEIGCQLHALAPLPLGKEPLVRRLGQPQSSSDCGGGAEKNPCWLGVEPMLSTSSQVLYWLSYPSSLVWELIIMTFFHEFQASSQTKGYNAKMNYTELCNMAAFDRAPLY
jgi:hypothetical protein